MKPKVVVTVVFFVHCVAVLCVMLSQGCGTPRADTTFSAPADRPMPPMVMPREEPRTRIVMPVPGATTGAAAWQGETTTYVIKKGENLSTIAKRLGVSVRAIIDLNKIADADRIYAGQKLRLPGKVDLTRKAPAPAAKKSTARRTPGSNDYIVRKGDSLSKIAVTFETTVRALRDANKLTSDRILIGQVLAIPREGSSPAPAVRNVRVPAPKPPVAPIPRRTIVKAPSAAAPPSVTAPKPVVVAPLPVVKKADPAPAEGDFVTHIVEEDEDVYSIAMNYTVLPEELKRLNKLTSNELEIGQKLKIPRPGR